MEKQEYKVMAEIEDDYWWYRGLQELVLAILEKYFPNRKDIALLDAGCGTGRMLELIDRAGYGRAEGFDYSPEALAFCRERGLQNVRLEDLNVWKPEENLYDALISLDVLYHSDVNDDKEVLHKFYRALRPEGILILNLPAFNLLKREHDAAVWTKKRYRAGSLKQDLAAAGFQVEQISYRLPVLFFAALAMKLKYLMLHPRAAKSDLKPLPEFINQLMLAVNRLDNALVKQGLNLLCGTSVFAVARKIDLK